MKIDTVSFYRPNNRLNEDFKTKEVSEPNFGVQNNPIGRALISDQVSFAGTTPVFFLKKIVDIPCLCCGVEMIRPEDFEDGISSKLIKYTTKKAAEALSPFEKKMNPEEKSFFKIIKDLSEVYPTRVLHKIFGITKSSAESTHAKALEHLDEKFLAPTGEMAIENISRFEKNLHPVERECFQILKEESIKNPQKKLKDILVEIKPEYLKRLKAEQLVILDKLEEVSKKLPEASSEKLNKIIKKERVLILADSQTESFKSKDFVKEIRELNRKVSEKEVTKELIDISKTLPASMKDLNAFVVKYSKRSSKEIEQRLVSTSVGTIDHRNAKALGGENSEKNYDYMCAGCNNPKGDQLYPEFIEDNPQMVHNIPKGTDIGGNSIQEWIKKHPEHKGNVQKHIDVIIEKINKGVIPKGHDWYPPLIMAGTEQQSKGAIKLDISKLKKRSFVDTEPLVEKYKKVPLRKRIISFFNFGAKRKPAYIDTTPAPEDFKYVKGAPRQNKIQFYDD